MRGLRLGEPADAADLASFLGRVVALDPSALTRLRAGGGRVTAYVTLPFGVLVSRTVTGAAEPVDVTVAAADLLAALDGSSGTDQSAGGIRATDRAGPAGGIGPAGGDGPASGDGSAGGAGPGGGVGPVAAGVHVGGRGKSVTWPALQDLRWRVALPPGGGWRLLDQVPGDVVRDLVRAGREALRAVPAGAAASAGETLLDHQSLIVTGAGRTAALPLRVLSALTKMGFLGDGDSGGGNAVMVSAAGRWVRLAGPYGSAYQHESAGLGLSPR